MQQPSSLATAVAHMEWADRKVLASLRAAPEPPTTALRLFQHILAAEIVWLDRIQNRPQSSAVWPDPDPEFAAAGIAGVRDRMSEILNDDDLKREVSYTNSDGLAFRTPVEDILMHVLLHGAYHRGQVALLLRTSGATPAPTDYIAMVRGTAAATNKTSKET